MPQLPDLPGNARPVSEAAQSNAKAHKNRSAGVPACAAAVIAYYHRLQAVSREGDWNGWISFFLNALVEQARSNTGKVTAILALYERMKREVPRTIHSQYLISAIDALFDRPVFQTSDFTARSGIPRHSTLRLINELRNLGFVAEIRPALGRRAGILVFSELIRITEA